VDSYLGRSTRAHIVEAVSEGYRKMALRIADMKARSECRRLSS
jgi:hypothetical protein